MTFWYLRANLLLFRDQKVLLLSMLATKKILAVVQVEKRAILRCCKICQKTFTPVDEVLGIKQFY